MKYKIFHSLSFSPLKGGWGILLCVLLLASCGSKKHASSSSAVLPDGTEGGLSPLQNIVQTVNANRQDETFATAKISFSAQSGEKSISMGGTLRMKRDDVIQISLVTFGILEVARLEVTPDYFMAINKVERQYLKASFQDVNLGLSHKINENNSIHAYGYWSRDKFSFSSDTTFRYRNINASLKWHSVFNDSHSMTAVAGYDSYHYSLEDTFSPYTAYRLSSAVDQEYAKFNFKSLLSDAHTLSYGVQATRYDLNPGDYRGVGDSSLVAARTLDRERAVEAALYLGDTWRITEGLTLDAGVRWSQFFRAGNKPVGGPEFRISGKYSFNSATSVKAGFNTMRQYIHMISNSINVSPTDSWRLSSDKIKPQSGWQAAAGFYRSLMDNTVDISVEGYYKRVQHYIDYMGGAVLVMNENLADDLIDTENRAYGVELMVKKTLGKLNGWVSYTWSRSQLRETEDRGVMTVNRGEWYNAAYDKPHDVKVVANYKFTHRYSLSVNLDYSTGRPVTVPVGTYQYANGTRLVYSDRNSYRIPDYFRLDLAMIIEPGHYLKQLTHMSFTFGCYNVTGRKNPYSVYYTSDDKKISGHMLSVFAVPVPYVNFNLKF